MTAGSAASLTVTLTQPAQVSDRARSDFVLGTRTHLPGAVVRGAFAARWLAVHHGPAEPGSAMRAEFVHLFEGGVRFGPLFHGNPPMPLSVLRHKYYEPAADCSYIDVDRAETDWQQTWCADCGSPMEPVTAEADPVVDKLTRRRTHVSIAPSQVAADGELVTRETLPAWLAFTGTLHTDDPTLLDVLADLGDIQVGGRRTTHGLAAVNIGPPVPRSMPWLRDDGQLVLTLTSPGVFVDDLGRPSRDPNARELTEILGCPTTVQRRWIRWTTVGGWHAASGLPKPTDLAVSAGSTYVLTPQGDIDDAALDRLSRRGLGLRRHEGFGDFGGRPTLVGGRAARQAEADRVATLTGSVAALRKVRNWGELDIRLKQAVDAQPGAVEQARRLVASSPAAQQALRRFLAMPSQDARIVLDQWRRP